MFCPDFFDDVGKRLDKGAQVNVKYMMSKNGKQIITIHILHNISKKR